VASRQYSVSLRTAASRAVGGYEKTKQIEKMADKEWIGIQFNFDEKAGLKDWIKKYESIGIQSDGEHITIEFGNNELKRLGSEQSAKIEILKSAVKKFLKKSDYTNIYTYLNADDLRNKKTDLLKGQLSTPIRVSEFQDPKSIVSNYKSKLDSVKVEKILKKDKLMIVMDEIFNFVVNRDFEKNQQLTLDLSFEYREEWGGYRDNLNMSIQLEKL